MQCVSDTWHATFGSMAIAIINSVFEHSPDKFATDEDCKAFTQEQLDNLKFLYGDITVKVYRSFIQVILTNLIYIALLPSSSRTFHSSHSCSSLLQCSWCSQGTIPRRSQQPFQSAIWCFSLVRSSGNVFLHCTT